jgi:hypothetical protein
MSRSSDALRKTISSIVMCGARRGLSIGAACFESQAASKIDRTISPVLIIEPCVVTAEAGSPSQHVGYG